MERRELVLELERGKRIKLVQMLGKKWTERWVRSWTKCGNIWKLCCHCEIQVHRLKIVPHLILLIALILSVSPPKLSMWIVSPASEVVIITKDTCVS